MRIPWKHLLFLLLIPTGAYAAEPVDRIAAVVNKQIIFLSDIQRFQTFFESPSNAESAPSKALQNLIDNRLLRAEARRFVLQGPSEEEVDQRLTSIRRRFESDVGFQQALRRTDFSLEEIKAEIKENIWVEKLLQERISLFIFVSPKEITQYRQEHAKEFAGKKEEAAERTIREILGAQKEAAKKKEYLARLKSRAEIEINLQ